MLPTTGPVLSTCPQKSFCQVSSPVGVLSSPVECHVTCVGKVVSDDAAAIPAIQSDGLLVHPSSENSGSPFA